MSNATGFRVIFHPPLCPACGGTDIEDTDVDTGDGITEAAHTCRSCGEAWPLGCVCDWDVPAANPSRSPLAGRPVPS